MKDRILNKFDEKSLLKKWEKSFPVGGLKYDLYEHWKEYVPIIFDPKYDLHNPTQLYVDESLVHKILFDPMEAFMCEGKDRDSVLQVLEQLSEYNEKSLVCGKVFKNGQPTYSCMECALDGTCVLCQSCFQNSQHRFHKYKIFTSSGGGICDCGDVEAWKADPYCTQHEPSTLNYSSQTANNCDISSNEALSSPTKALLSENANNLMLPDLIDRLPEHLVNRASSVLLSTLQYSVLMLTWPDALTLPQIVLTEPDHKPMDEQPTDDSLFDLFYSKQGQKYITMLYNDEVHTYEQVITTLCRAIDCTHKEGVDFATIVDRDGRSPVYISAQKTECERVKTSIERSTSRHGSRALRVCVFEARIVAHQSFALRCLSWIANFISYSDGLKLLACNLTLQPIDNECFDGMAENGQVGSTLLEHLLLHDTSIWKAARMKCHEILISNMLLFPETKKRLALIFTQHYSRILDDYIENDVEGHSLSVISTSVQLYTVPSLHYATMAKTYVSIEDLWEDDSISDFSVQIFTTPSIAKYLIVHKDVLTVVIETFIQIAKKYRNADGKLNFDRNQPHTPFRRAQYILNDLHYLLSAPPKATSEWTHLLKRNFLNGFNSMLNLLSSIQNMDLIVRQTRQHVDYEPEWETAFNLTYKLIPCLLGFEQWIASSCNEDLKNNSESIRRVISPDNLLVKAFGRTSRALFRLNKKFGVEKMKYPIICASQLSHATKNDSDSSLDLEMKSLSTMLNIEVIKYDVATQPVSVHLPITRLYIGLYLQLLELGLNYNSPCLLLDIPRTADKNASQQTEDLNNNCNDENTATDHTVILNARKDTIINKDYGKTPSPAELMEYPLRCIVLCAQVLDGMWRRNGYYLLNQCFLYKNAKWRHYMYDRDIMALQIGASIMLQKSFDSSGSDYPLDRKEDTFLLRLLNKYDLSLFLQRFTAQCLMFMNIDIKQCKLPPIINQNVTNIEFHPDLLEKIPLIVALQSRTLDIKSVLSSLHDRVTWTHTFNQSKNKVDKVDKQLSHFTDCYISDWWSDQEIVRQNMTLLEEYLSLVIYITNERYNVKIGRTTEIDIIRRQVIHQLCLGPLAHSELCKALPENSSKHPDLETIIKEVAQLKKSTEPTAKMKYVLRVEFFTQFDPFYYHYTKGELNKANEYRQLRLGQDLKIKGLIPPKPPQFNTAFTVLSGLLCKSEFLLQTQMVILYAYYMNMSFSKENIITSKALPLLTHITEELVHQVIHLFCLALYETSPYKSNQQNQIGVAYLTKVLNLGIPQILTNINAIDTSTPHSELITFALKMFNEIYEEYFGQVSPLIANTAQNQISRENMDIVNANSSKTTFNTVLTQQDELPLNPPTVNVMPKEISNQDSLNKMVNSKKSGEVARNRRHKILAQMSRAQKAFIKTHKDLWESVAAPPQQQNPVEQITSCGVTDATISNQQGAAVVEISEKERNVLPNNLSSQKLYQTNPNVKTSFESCVFSPHRLKGIIGRQQNSNSSNAECNNVLNQSIISNNFPRFTCILCQEENSIAVCLAAKSGGQNDLKQENGPQNTLVMAAFVQNTTSLSKLNTMSPKNPHEEINDDELDVRTNHIAPKAYDTIVRSCGHVMHESCWSRLCENVVKRERTQLSRFRFYHSAIDIDRREYMCPLCNALGNTALPLFPHHPYLIGLTLTPHWNEKETVSIEESTMDVENNQQVNTDDTSIDWQNACTSNKLTSPCRLNSNPVLSDDDLYGDSIPFYAWMKLIRAWVKLVLVKSRSVTENSPPSAAKKVGKHAKRISNDSINNTTNRKSGGEEKGHLKHEPTLINENLAIEKESDRHTFLTDPTAAFIDDCFGRKDVLLNNSNIYKEYFKCWLASNMASSPLKELATNKPNNVTSISVSTMNMIQAFSSSILTISTESHPYDQNNESLPLTAWQSLASTIQSIYYYAAFETNIRFPAQNVSDNGHSNDEDTKNSKHESESSDIKPSQDSIVSEELTSLPIRYVQCLRYLVTFVNYLSSNILSTNPNLLSQQAIYAFSKMFGLYTTHPQFLPSKGNSDDKRPPIKLQLYGTPPLVVNGHDTGEFFSEGYVEFEPVLDVLLANSDNIDHPFLAQNMMDSNDDGEDGEYFTSSDETEEAHMPVNMHYYQNYENSEEPLIIPFNEATNAILPRPDKPNELIRTLNDDFKHARKSFNFILDTDMFSNMIILTQSCHHLFSHNIGDKNSPTKDEPKTINPNNSSLSQNFANLEDLENQIDYTSLVVPNDLNENDATISSDMDVGPTHLVTTQLSSDSFNDNSFEKYLSPPSTRNHLPKALTLNGFCPMDAFDRFVVRFSFLGEFVKSLLFFGCPNISQSYTGGFNNTFNVIYPTDLPLINIKDSQKSEYAFTYALCSYLSSEHFGFFKDINEPKTEQSPKKKSSQKVQSFQTFMRQEMQHLIHDDKSRMYQSYLLTLNVKRGLLPFLYCTAIYMHYMTNVPIPTHILKVPITAFKPFDLNNNDDKKKPESPTLKNSELLNVVYNSLCSYIGIESNLYTFWRLCCENGLKGLTKTQNNNTFDMEGKMFKLIFGNWLNIKDSSRFSTFFNCWNADKIHNNNDKCIKMDIELLKPQSLLNNVKETKDSVPRWRTWRLIQLPHDYADLIGLASTFVCPTQLAEQYNQRASTSYDSKACSTRAPTLCLVCGTLLCSQSYCCQTHLILDARHGDRVVAIGSMADEKYAPGLIVWPVGACMAHSFVCGAGTGLFLRIRECQILMLFGRTRGTFVASPYIDAYGETDQGLKRGNPLFLCPERYRAFEKLWITNSIPDEIVRSLESNPNLLSIDWQHL